MTPSSVDSSPLTPLPLPPTLPDTLALVLWREKPLSSERALRLVEARDMPVTELAWRRSPKDGLAESVPGPPGMGRLIMLSSRENARLKVGRRGPGAASSPLEVAALARERDDRDDTLLLLRSKRWRRSCSVVLWRDMAEACGEKPPRSEDARGDRSLLKRAQDSTIDELPSGTSARDTSPKRSLT